MSTRHDEFYGHISDVKSSSEVVNRSIDHFGLTTDMREAGYILANGQFLDLSEKNNGGEAGQRGADHCDIGQFYDDVSGTDALIQFMNEGNIRLMPENGGIDIAMPPTKEQYDALRTYINYFRGNVIVDISSTTGDNLFSQFYDEKTSSSKVVGDIKDHFSNNEVSYMENHKDYIAESLKGPEMPTPGQSITDEKDLLDYLRFAQQHPQLSANGCAQAYDAMPEASHLDTAEGYAAKGMKVLSEQEGKGIFAAHHEIIEYIIKNGEAVDVSQTAPADLAAIETGELRVRSTPAEEIREVYDISQTDCPRDRYPEVTGDRSLLLSDQQCYGQLKGLAERCGMPVLEEEMSNAVHGYYDANSNTLRINSGAPVAGQADALMHGYAKGLVENTSTQPDSVKSLETESLYASMCAKAGIPVDEAHMGRLGGSLRQCRQDPYFRLEDGLGRVHKMVRMVHQNMDVSMLDQARVQTEMQSAAPAQFAQHPVSANFMNGL